MGDNVSVEQTDNFEDRLQFVQTVEDENFGCISIFRFKEPPYQYIMNFQKTFIEGDTRVHEYRQFMTQIKSKQHKNIAKIHTTHTKKQNHMCIKDTKVHTYCNFYNFTLKQAIDKKKIKQNKFTEAELCFVMFCLLDLAVYLKKYNIVYGEFRPNRIFLSPEGYIKIFLLYLEKNNKHTSYYKTLIEKSLIDEFILSPEELQFLAKMEYQPKFDIYKAEVFAIGMVILELLTLDKAKFYYNQDRTGLKMGRINFDLSSYSSSYSFHFLELLRGCLLENPQDRLSLEEALKMIEQVRSKSTYVSYCLRLHEEGQTVKKQKPAISTKGQYILNGIEKRLTPYPITSLSSSTSSGFQSRNTLSRTSQNQKNMK